MIRTIIFDVDGTLLDTEKVYMQAWREAAVPFGYHIPEQALKQTRAVNNTIALEVFRRFCGQDFPYKDIQKERIVIAERIINESTAEQLHKPHAVAVLERLKGEGYTMAVASSTEQSKTEEHLRHAGLLDYFPVVVGGDMVERGKPNPDIFLKAAELAGAKAEECLVVGDTPADVFAATAAGMPVVLIPDQVPANEETTALSLRVLEHLGRLPELLKGWCDRGAKLILVSMDALVFEDLEYLSQKPNFKWLMEHGAMVSRVKSIYPTLTYPCHATMATGRYPTGHGVTNNEQFQPGVEPSEWKWYHTDYHARDLVDAAKERGLTTACIGWPTMGNHPNADYIVAEIAGTKARTAEEYRRDYLATGTTPELWQEVCAPYIQYREGGKGSTYFNMCACCDIIRSHAPDLVLLHVSNVDGARHKFGVFSEEIRSELDICEEQLAMLRQAIRDSGAEDVTNLVITADHGQLDCLRKVSPNVLLAQNGLIETDEQGAVTDWKAWSLSAGMCATVYVKDPADEPRVRAVLEKCIGNGVSRIYSREEAAAEGYAGDFAFVLETDDVTYFKNNWIGAYQSDYDAPKGNHGYHPDKGSRPFMLCHGPAFCEGAALPEAHLVDGAPTWAQVLGVDLPDTDGRVLKELLK